MSGLSVIDAKRDSPLMYTLLYLKINPKYIDHCRGALKVTGPLLCHFSLFLAPRYPGLPMFCSSLRKRREWAQVPSSLLAQQEPRWKGSPTYKSRFECTLLTTHLELHLETHDLALPLPQRYSQNQQEWFRLLLFSPSDTHPESNYMARIERLYHLTGGSRIGIVFLLRDSGSQEDGTRTLMTLQLR